MGTHRRTDDKLPLWRKMLAFCLIILAAAVLVAWSLSAKIVTAATPSTAQSATATPAPSVSSSSVAETSKAMPIIGQEPTSEASTQVDATGIPLTITSAELGFQDTPLSVMQAGPPGTAIVPPVSETNPVESFKPYFISSFGPVGPTSQDTSYIIGHACSAGCTPEMLRFNRLSDLKPGNVIGFATEKGAVTCKVTRSVTYDQEAPASEKGDTWGYHPGYVVIISCSPEDFHGKSTSVFAKCGEA